MTASGSASPVRDRDFQLFWLAQAVSRFGDPITVIGLAAMTYQLTESALYTSFAVMVATLPQATFGFFAGPIADALGHRRAMIVADLLRALAIGLIPPVFHFGLPLGLAYLLVFFAGLCSAVFQPARGAIIPAIVRRDQLVAANSAVYATDRTVEILGAVAGGILVATVGVGVFFIDALTFLVGGVLMAQVRVAEEAAPRRISWRRAVTDAASGLRIIRRSTVLFGNTAFSLAAQLSIPVLTGLMPVYIFRRFANGDAAAGASLFGFAEAAIAAGAVAGSMFIARLSRRVHKGTLLLWGFGACGASMVAVALAPSFEVLLVVLFATGITNVLFFVPNAAIMQEYAPAQMRGMVIGARISLLHLSWLPVALIAGGLADLADVALLIGLAGAFTVMVAVVGTRIRSVSTVP